MKKIIGIGICLCQILLFNYCQTKNPCDIDIPTIIPDWQNKAEAVFDLDTLVKDFELIPLDNSENVTVADIVKLVISEDRIYLTDRFGSKQETLWIFNTEGRFENIIHTPGKGPGEYLEIFEFCIDEVSGQIVIIDARADKMLIYNKNAELLQDISIPLEQGSYNALGNELYVRLKGRFVSKGDNQPFHELEIFNQKNKKLKSWFPFINNWEGWKPDEIQLTRYKDGFLVHHPYDFNLYFLDSSYDLTTLLKFDYGSKAIDTTGFYESTSFINFHIECNQRQRAYEYRIGSVIPIGNDLFLSKGMNDGRYYMIISGDNFNFKEYQSIEYSLLGFYHGWPVPAPISHQGDYLYGIMSPLEIMQMWDKYPGMKKKVESDDRFKKILLEMTPYGNPIVFKIKMSV